MKTPVLALTLASIVFGTACARKHHDKKASKAAAPKAAQRDTLKEAFSFEPRFNSADQTVSGLIVGADAEMKDTSTFGPYSKNKLQTLVVSVRLKNPTIPVAFTSDAIAPAKMAEGKPFAMKYEDDLSKFVDGDLTVKGLCLDATCNRVGVLMEVWPLDADHTVVQPKFAGIVFVYGDKGYTVEASNSGKLPAVPTPSPVPFM